MDDSKICGLVPPFFPDASIRADYVNPVRPREGVYAGLEDSALMCEFTQLPSGWINTPMTSESYQCPASVLPFKYSAWDEKWYSPVCRGWFKDSFAAGNRGIISDPYMMA